jgi:hypothetical protein
LREREDSRTKYGNRDVSDWTRRTKDRPKFGDVGQPHTGVISRLVCKRALNPAKDSAASKSCAPSFWMVISSADTASPL